MKKPTLEQLLAQIRAGDVRAALASGSFVAVEAAAKRAEEDRIACAEELALAFAVRPDSNCRARIAIARAMVALDAWDDRVFTVGIATREASKVDDPSAALRGICAIGYANMYRRDAPEVCAALLADPFPVARQGAAQALAVCPGTVPLLRYKVLIGDADNDVLAACIDALLATGRDEATPFLVGLLAEHDVRSEIIGLALGGARLAVDEVLAWCKALRPLQRQRVGFLAVALTRSEAGNKYLRSIVADGGKLDVAAARQALATFD